MTADRLVLMAFGMFALLFALGIALTLRLLREEARVQAERDETERVRQNFYEAMNKLPREVLAALGEVRE